MPKINTLFPMSGTIGNVTLRQTEEGCIAQTKGGPTRDQVLYSDDFANTRRNASDFKTSIEHATLLRRAMGVALNGIKFKNLSGRMNGIFREMANSDTKSKWGKREGMKGDVALLKGFEFNDKLALDEVLPAGMECSMDVARGIVSLTVPSFKVRRQEELLKAATHCKVLSCVVSVNFEKRRYKQCIKESVLLPLGKRIAAPLSFEHQLAAGEDEVLFHMVGVEYYTEKGSKFKLVDKGCMRVMEVARGEVADEEKEVAPGEWGGAGENSCLYLGVSLPIMTDHNEIPDSVEIIDEHLGKFFDPEEVLVLHEMESEIIHSDIFIVKPAEDRNYNLLMTCGMSALSMKMPEELEHLKFAEIIMLLPAGWNLNYDDFADENNYWPVRPLKQLSKYPHLNDTWFGYGHTIRLDNSHEVNHNFHGVILLESITLSEDFTYIESAEKEVVVYSAIPIYKEELEFVLEQGTGKLLALFQEYGVDEVVDIKRRNVCK